MVIRLTAQDRKRPIELFYEEHAYHLMGKCHTRQRELLIRPLVDFLGKTIRSSDDKYQMLDGAHHFLLDKPGKPHGVEGFPFLVQKHDNITIAYLF